MQSLAEERGQGKDCFPAETALINSDNGLSEGVQADLDYFKPKPGFDERYARMANTRNYCSNYGSFGYPGCHHDRSNAEARRCRGKKTEVMPTRFINAHLYVSRHGKAVL